MEKKNYIKEISKIAMIVLCACLYAFFFKVIVEGRGFLSTGASGLAVIFSRIIGYSIGKEALVSILYMIINIAINVPLLIFGYTKISKKFIINSMIFVLVYSLVVGFVPQSLGSNLGFDELDDLTSAILIGLISGFSCAGTMISGGCAGGLDIVSTYLNVKKGKGIGTYKFIFNGVILFLGLLIFKDIASIVYTLVYAFVSSIVLDRYYNRNKKILLEIVTTKKEEVCKYLLEHSHHGCTIFSAKGAYSQGEKDVIHTVISWFQLKAMTKAIMQIDEKCFIINLNVYNVNGAFYLPPIK
jgi:uncharacterized membrane-anchored protein YitT (DUF2179 family)